MYMQTLLSLIFQLGSIIVNIHNRYDVCAIAVDLFTMGNQSLACYTLPIACRKRTITTGLIERLSCNFLSTEGNQLHPKLERLRFAISTIGHHGRQNVGKRDIHNIYMIMSILGQKIHHF